MTGQEAALRGRGKQPIFVLGTARSGTSWCANLLAMHPDVAAVATGEYEGITGIHESHLFSHTRYCFPEKVTAREFVARYREEDYFKLTGLSPHRFAEEHRGSYEVAELFRALMDDFAAQRGARVWLEKTPKHTIYYEELLRYFPDARFVVTRRGFRDTLLSNVHKYPRRGASFSRQVVEKVFRYESDRRAIARLRRLCPGRVIDVAYEDLARDTQAEVARLLRFLRLAPRELESAFPSNSAYAPGGAPTARIGALGWLGIYALRGAFSAVPFALMRRLRTRRDRRKASRRFPKYRFVPTPAAWSDAEGQAPSAAEVAGAPAAPLARPLAVILTGTDPENALGGIGSSLVGYRQALIERGIFGGFVPTFRSGSLSGKWRPWLRALPVLRRTIRSTRKQGKTVVVYGHAGPRVSLVRESLVLLWARLWGARTMLQLHTPHMDRYLDRAVVRGLLRIAFLPVECLTVLSPWWRERMAAGGFGGTVVIPNPLSAELEDAARAVRERALARTSAETPRRELIVLAMARLTRGKGIHTAVEALRQLPEHVVLHVAGDGPQLEPLQSLARRLGVAERVRFLGWVSGPEKVRALTEADAFCAPSKADAFSMSVVEALCHGLPVVAARSRAIADLVKDSETGFLVEADDPKGIAQAIEQLGDSSLRARIGRDAASWASRELGAEAVGRRIEQAASALPARPRRRDGRGRA